MRQLNFRWMQLVEFSFLAQTCQMFREFTCLHLNFCWWSVVTVLHWKELSTNTWLMVNSVWVRHLHNFLKCQWLHTVCLSIFKKTLDDFWNGSPSVRISTLMIMFKTESFYIWYTIFPLISGVWMIWCIQRNRRYGSLKTSLCKL